MSLLLSLSTPIRGETINIAVAANFLSTAQQLVQAFSQSNNHNILISSGSSGKLFIQIKHGAPFHLFLSADTDRPKRLIEEGIARDDLKIYATGQLALWSKHYPEIEQGLEVLDKNHVTRLAIANPKTAPYGVAAIEVLASRKPAYDGVIVQGDNIAQTYQFAASGNVDAAFVALSQITKLPQGYYWPVPHDIHTPLHQGAVLLKTAQDNVTANAFYDFLSSQTAQQIIRQNGYLTF